ncbi:MAG: DUF4136 domain-containing protein [Gemmatimonadales bacterium]|jgi:hypothetical protein
MNGWQLRLTVAATLLSVAGCSTVRYSEDFDPQASFSDYRTYDWILPSEDEQAALERINPFLERRLQRAVEGEMARRGFELSPAAEPDLLVSVYPVVPERGADSSGRAGAAYGRGAHRTPVQVSVGFGFGFGRPYGYGYRYPYFGYPYGSFGYPYAHFGYPYAWGFGYPYFAFAFPLYGYPGYGWGSAYHRGYYHSAGGYGYSSPAALDGLAPGTLVVDVVDARTRELIWRGWAEGAFYDMPRPEQLDEYIGRVVGKTMKGFPPPDAERR